MNKNGNPYLFAVTNIMFSPHEKEGKYYIFINELISIRGIAQLFTGCGERSAKTRGAHIGV